MTSIASTQNHTRACLSRPSTFLAQTYTAAAAAAAMAAAASTRTPRTASTSALETARGTHTFKIAGYSLHSGLGRSATFEVGGYGWCIRFYPDGYKYPDYVALSLELRDTKAEVRASFELRLLDQATTGQSSAAMVVRRQPTPLVFSSKVGMSWCQAKAKKRYELGDNDEKEMARHLLVAADRYAMERLKVMCETVLCESIDADNVATMLALADRHHCRALGDACAEFIASSNRNMMGDVVASQGYVHLKRACPDVLVDILERVVTKCLQRCKK